MLSIHKILVPVVFAATSRHVVHQAAWLARRFHAEVILLHVVTPLSYPAGMLESGHEITARDLHAHIVQRAQKDLDQALGPELDGIAVTRVLLRGDPAYEIVNTARDRNVDLIVMSTRGEGAFYRLLLGSVTAKVLHETDCPVWTGAHLEEHAEARVFDPPRSLFGGFNAAQPAHIVAGCRDGPPRSMRRLRSSTSRPVWRSRAPADPTSIPCGRRGLSVQPAEEIAKLQQDVGTKAEVIIDSGNVPELLNRAAERTKADVLVIGHIPGRGHLRDNGEGYGIIRASQIPVLSV